MRGTLKSRVMGRLWGLSVAVGGGLAVGLGAGLPSLAWPYGGMSYVGGALAATLATFWLLERWGWRWPWVGRWLQTPNLEGRYEGSLESSYTNEHQEHPRMACIMEIRQSATRIHVVAYFGPQHKNLEDSSGSHSFLEGLVRGADGVYYLHYQYHNEAELLFYQLHEHSGTVQLKYVSASQQLIGTYYNLRGHRGKISVTRVSRRRLGESRFGTKPA